MKRRHQKPQGHRFGEFKLNSRRGRIRVSGWSLPMNDDDQVVWSRDRDDDMGRRREQRRRRR